MIKISLTAEDVRRLCINCEWYTNGSNEQYNNMLNYVRAVFGSYGDTYISPKNAENAIIKIADNIIDNSNFGKIMDDYGVSFSEVRPTVISCILNQCARYKFVND